MNKLSHGVLMDPDPGAAGGGVSAADVTKLIEASSAKLRTELQGMLKPFEGVGASIAALTESLTGMQAKLEEKPADKKTGQQDPETAALLKKLQTDLASTNGTLAKEKELREKAEKASEQTSRESALRTALGKFEFASPAAAEDAFQLLISQVDRGDDGKLISNGLPLDDFLADHIPSAKAHLLMPMDKGGTGARRSSTAGGGPGQFQIENIKPGMSISDQRAAAAAIAQAINVGGAK